jgi:hypothetical protein
MNPAIAPQAPPGFRGLLIYWHYSIVNQSFSREVTPGETRPDRSRPASRLVLQLTGDPHMSGETLSSESSSERPTTDTMVHQSGLYDLVDAFIDEIASLGMDGASDDERLSFVTALMLALEDRLPEYFNVEFVREALQFGEYVRKHTDMGFTKA